MVKEFEGKNQWTVILGSSSGLGLATAKKLAQHGLNLCLVYRARKSDTTKIQTTFQTIATENSVELLEFNLDFVKPENRTLVCDALTQKSVRVLVHSVAKGNLKPMIANKARTLQNDDFHLTIESMGISLYDWTKSLFDNNRFAAEASIVSFTSEGNKKAWPNYAAVSAAKATLEAITRNLALEFAPHGIHANCIEAGVTDTASLRMIPGSEKLIEHTKKRNPNKRLTTPEDVANVVYLLSKDEARWINGAVIPVNGGEHLS